MVYPWSDFTQNPLVNRILSLVKHQMIHFSLLVLCNLLLQVIMHLVSLRLLSLNRLLFIDQHLDIVNISELVSKFQFTQLFFLQFMLVLFHLDEMSFLGLVCYLLSLLLLAEFIDFSSLALLDHILID